MSATQAEWRLEVLSPDGQVGRAIELHESELDLGRTAAGLQFSEDSEMADRHARLRIRNEGVEVSDTAEGSGVWIRVQGSAGRRLAEHDQIWVGAQILVVVREDSTWKLRHHGPDGRALELYSVMPPGVFVGRDSDLILDPADRALSRRHAQVVVDADQLVLYDRGAHNGTYLKLSEPEMLSPGDEFRLAAQHLRLSGSNGSELSEASEAREGAAPAGVRGGGLASRLRALGSAPAREAAAPSGIDTPGGTQVGSSDVGKEPNRAGGALDRPEAETALIVIDSGEESVTLEVEVGKTVLEAVQEAGLERGTTIDWECLDGRCGVCIVGVVDGANRLEPPDRATAEMRTIQITEQVTPDAQKYRLACLARVRGSVRLRRMH